MEGRLSLVRKIGQGVGPLEKESVLGRCPTGVQPDAVAAKMILVTL